jgi:lipooligosaccharide transport system ATP-binding protein
MVIVSAKGVKKDYNSFRAVNGVDFEIYKGECFGFLGPNGAGKTTIMRMIHCFMPPTSGSINIFGLDVYRDSSLIKSKIGVMPQEENLDIDLSVLENLIVYARYFDISRKASSLRALQLLEFVELKDKAGVNIKNLSGGMKRRLLLARALINEPELLILDEPTVGLDPHSRHAVWDSLTELKSNGKTLILTTHYMEEAEQICDRVAIMDSGRILTIDTPMNLMRKHDGNLEHVYLNLTGRRLAN